MLFLRPIVPFKAGLGALQSSSKLLCYSTTPLAGFATWQKVQHQQLKRQSLISTLSMRFSSSLQKPDEDAKKVIPADVYEKQQVVERRIPGEREQTNSLSDRFPSTWHFDQEAIPTLLPRPGVPEPNKYPLARMYNILKSKKTPELIYEAEPHKMYFVAAYCFAAIFIIYGINALTIGWDLTQAMYQENELNLDPLKLNLEYAMHLMLTFILGMLPLSTGIAFIWLPTRLIRRMWFLPGAPGRDAYIRFTTHPLFPNRPTPVRTLPVSDFQKSVTAKIYSGKGFYGVTDSSFFFFLREKGSRIPFIVDRKGFFWGDGRVFDLVFSKDSIDSVENAKKIDEVYGDILREKQEQEEKLKKKYGFGWRAKAATKLMAEDVKKMIEPEQVPEQIEQAKKVKKVVDEVKEVKQTVDDTKKTVDEVKQVKKTVKKVKKAKKVAKVVRKSKKHN